LPEGPEIRIAADELDDALRGRTAQLVEFAFAHLQAHTEELRQQIITAVEPRGKAMLTHFSNGRTIYSHNQLYGEWVILRRGQPPRPNLQIRLAIHTEDAVAVLYSASSIEVWNSAEIGNHPYIARLGVELLAARTTLAEVRAQIEAPRFARKALAVVLLDQGFLAGIGNYLRSEILFVARIHPAARIADLDSAQRDALAHAAFELAQQSYRTRGITNDLAIARRLKAEGVSYARYRHWAFARAGEPCHQCGTPIERIEQGGRGLYWCARCQAKPLLAQRKSAC
jgi:endonuclease VIII